MVEFLFSWQTKPENPRRIPKERASYLCSWEDEWFVFLWALCPRTHHRWNWINLFLMQFPPVSRGWPRCARMLPADLHTASAWIRQVRGKMHEPLCWQQLLTCWPAYPSFRCVVETMRPVRRMSRCACTPPHAVRQHTHTHTHTSTPGLPRHQLTEAPDKDTSAANKHRFPRVSATTSTQRRPTSLACHTLWDVAAVTAVCYLTLPFNSQQRPVWRAGVRRESSITEAL